MRLSSLRPVKVLSVVGARPQFVKLAPISRALAARGVEHEVIHTGQHYDAKMSDVFFDDFGIPEPDVNLEIGSGSHGVQTGLMLQALEPVIEESAPDWVLVYGDTNSTLAAAVAAVKIGTKVAHLEAGLRSFNRTMPEEHNRILTDHSADLLLAPTQLAVDNLAREGLADKTRLVGDVMADICLSVAEIVRVMPPPDIELPDGDFLLATLHRPYNTDDPERLRRIIGGLSVSPVPVFLAAHPRLVAKAHDAGIDLNAGAVTAIEPLSYPSLVYAAATAAGVVTDSGGLQKEAYLLGVPCTTVRSETEWVETLDGGWNMLVFDDLEGLAELALRGAPSVERPPVFGTGHAAEEVVDALISTP